MWSSDKTSVVLLVSENDVLEKMAYTIANPTVAGLVKSPDKWPGVISKEREVEMPDGFFDHEGSLPDALTLKFVRPRIFVGLSDPQVQAQLNTQIAKRVKGAREDMKLRRMPFVGRDTVLRQAFSAKPRTPAPRRKPSQRIAAKSATERMYAIRRMLDFVQGYRAVWHDWRNGNRAAVFRLGTYALGTYALGTYAPRIYARVACTHAVPA